MSSTYYPGEMAIDRQQPPATRRESSIIQCAFTGFKLVLHPLNHPHRDGFSFPLSPLVALVAYAAPKPKLDHYDLDLNVNADVSKNLEVAMAIANTAGETLKFLSNSKYVGLDDPSDFTVLGPGDSTTVVSDLSRWLSTRRASSFHFTISSLSCVRVHSV